MDAIVIRDQTTKQSRGFGFVTFATINSAEAAMLDRPHVIGGKTVSPVNRPRTQLGDCRWTRRELSHENRWHL